MSDYENVPTETRGRVGIITLNRPKALNTLNHKTMEEVGAATTSFDRDSGIGAIITTGSEKAFVVGADTKEMADRSDTKMYVSDWFSGWNVSTSVRTPVIATVDGYAFGDGCETAMMIDFIIAGSGAKFGQPEVNLGVTPGMDGSQRLTRAIGKAKTMGMCLTGRMMGAGEAESAGLVARIIEPEALLDEVLRVADAIAPRSLATTTQIKEQINQAYEMTLSQGLLFERRTFHSLFSSNDQKEGMAAFTEKYEADFTNSQKLLVRSR